MTKPNTSKVRLAVVGCGAVAQIHHLPAIAASDRVEAAVLVDADEKRARALAERFGVPEVATDFKRLPGKVEAAVVALPNSLHAPVSIELLRRGVHVLVEKPMAMTVRECDEMIDAARDRPRRARRGARFPLLRRLAVRPRPAARRPARRDPRASTCARA